jgi:hypothetical protein
MFSPGDGVIIKSIGSVSHAVHRDSQRCQAGVGGAINRGVRPDWTQETKKPVIFEMTGFSFNTGAGKEARTLDLYLGKVSLYQLSYSRIDYLTAPAWAGRYRIQ